MITNLLNGFLAPYGLRHTITSYTRQFKELKTAIYNIFIDIDDGFVTSKVLCAGLSDHHVQGATDTVAAPSLQPVPEYRMHRNVSVANINTFRYYIRNETCYDILVFKKYFDPKFEGFLNTFYNNSKYIFYCILHFKQCQKLYK